MSVGVNRGKMVLMTLLDQTVLRAPNGVRWVVHTAPAASGYTTTARRTGCDLTPVASATSASPAAARAAHDRFCAAIKQRGEPA